MVFRAKENILQFKRGDYVDEIQDNWKPYFEEVGVKKEVSLDLDGDGDFDADDKKIAGKVLASKVKKKSKKR